LRLASSQEILTPTLSDSTDIAKMPEEELKIENKNKNAVVLETTQH
jgi:hypothetical protein